MRYEPNVSDPAAAATVLSLSAPDEPSFHD